MDTLIYTKAVESLIGKSNGFTVSGTDYTTLEIFDSNVAVPTEQEILTAYATAEAQHNLKMLREERNQLLADTDWWASSDLTMTSEQEAYRQALRDITDAYTSLDDVVWPTKP